MNCYGYIAILETISFCWLMLNLMVRNTTVWTFYCVYLENVFINHIIDIHVKRGCGIK